MNDQDRRRFVRHEAAETCFAALRAGEVTVGRVRDISMGGLSFEYLDNEDFPPRLDVMEHVDLFMAGGKCVVRKIPCKSVRDNRVGFHANTFAGIGLRLRGVKFVDLPETVCHQVEDYIAQCHQT